MQRAQVQSLVGELKGDILRRVAKVAWGIITHHVLFCELAWITSLNPQQWPYPLGTIIFHIFGQAPESIGITPSDMESSTGI